MSEELMIYGKNAIIEALESESREFNKILIANGLRQDEKIEKIKKLAKQRNIIFQFTDKVKLNHLAPGEKHQGVVAQISPIKYEDFDEFIETHNSGNTSLIILDGIEDSHNFGAIIRSAVCAGIDGIIIPSRRNVMVNQITEKSSAGAINHIPVIKVNSLVSAVQRLKENDYWVIASDHHSKENYYDIDYTDMNFVLIMGAEHAGISASLLKLSDYRVKIPMLTKFNSLNVSNATAIIMFEYVRQKLVKNK